MSTEAPDLAPWVTRLKVKQAKAILEAKSIDCTDIVEKQHLLKIVAEHIESEAEATSLLSPGQNSAEGGQTEESDEKVGGEEDGNKVGSVPIWPGKGLKLRSSMLGWYDDFIAGTCFILLVVWITMDDWVPLVCASETRSKLFRFSAEFCAEFIKTRLGPPIEESSMASSSGGGLDSLS